MRRFLNHLIRACVAILLVAAPVTAAPVTAAPREGSGVITTRTFGMHIHHALDRGNPWPSAPFGTWRLWDAYVFWYNLEPVKGQWNFTLLDADVNEAQRRNIELIMPLAMPPTWASARPAETGPYGPTSSTAEPRDLTDWARYVATVATRYKGRIRYYEVWNEPNMKQFYTGDVAHLVELTRVASETLKAIDPNIKVIGPAVTGADLRASLGYLNDYLMKGGGKYIDIVSHHFYTASSGPETAVDNIRSIKTILSLHGQSKKPLWNSEVGWHIANADGTTFTPNRGWKVLDPGEESAAYMARAHILNLSEGVERVYWYAWDNGNMGMVEPKTQTPKPMAAIYGQLQTWLIGRSLGKCTVKAEVWACPVTQSGKAAGFIVWRQEAKDLNWRAPAMWQPPVAWKIRSSERLGAARTALAAKAGVTVGGTPVWLRP